MESTKALCLSPGEQRVVLLARALVKKPQLLILDEPCRAAHRRIVVDSTDRLIRSHDLKVFFATHRTDEVPSAIARVLRLGKKGRVIEQI